MADISSAQFDQLLKTLQDLTKSGASFGGGSTNQSGKDRVRATTMSKSEQDASAFYKEFKKVHKEDSKNARTLQEQLKYSNSLFSKSIAGAKDIGDLEKRLPNAFAAEFAKSGSTFIQAMSDSVKNMEDVFNAQTKIENMPTVIALMSQFKAGSVTFAELNSQIHSLGYNAEEHDALLGNINSQMVDLNGNLIQNTHTVADVDDALERLAKDAGTASEALGEVAASTGPNRMGGLKALGPVAKALGTEMLGAVRAAAKYGTTLQMIDAKLMGLSYDELGQLQSSNRQAILALGGSTDEFNSMIQGNTVSMIKFTGELGAATKATAHIISTSRMLGDANVDTSKFLKQQTDTFGRFNRVLGMTSDQFADMSTTLIGDQEIRKNLLRMDKTKRVQAFQDIQMTYEKLRLDGLQHEQAIAMVKQMEGVAGRDAKTRLTEGAKISSILGGLGMGKEGEEARGIMAKGTRASAEEKSRLQEIMVDANKMLAKQIGENNENALSIEGQVQYTNMGHMLGPGSEYTEAALAEGARAAEGAKAQLQQDKIFGKHMDFVENHWTEYMAAFDIFAAFMSGPLFGAVTAGFTKMMGGAGGVGGSGGVAGGKAMGKLGKVAGVGGGLLAAAAIGWEIGSYINNAILSDDTKEGIGDFMGATVDFFTGRDRDAEEAARTQADRDGKAERQRKRDHNELVKLQMKANKTVEEANRLKALSMEAAGEATGKTIKALEDTGYATQPNN